MFRGSMVALVTPMSADGQIHEKSLRHLINWHIEKGTDALIVAGTTGESPTLTAAEQKNLIKIVLDETANRIPVIAGTGHNSTQAAVMLTEQAAELGVDGCLVVTPYYNKPTQEGLFLHYEKIANAVDIPIILYNVPGRTSCDCLPDTVVRLAEIKNIIGIKEATGDLKRAQELLERCPSDFLIYSGDDKTAFELIKLGGHGVISVTANVAPRLMAEMVTQALKQNYDVARALDAKLAPLHDILFVEANPIPVKWALEKLDLIPSGIRLPLTPLSLKHHDNVLSVLANLKDG
jgi:4-hydroxy-tetrahydrodipicolinate synthase